MVEKRESMVKKMNNEEDELMTSRLKEESQRERPPGKGKRERKEKKGQCGSPEEEISSLTYLFFLYILLQCLGFKN